MRRTNSIHHQFPAPGARFADRRGAFRLPGSVITGCVCALFFASTVPAQDLTGWPDEDTPVPAEAQSLTPSVLLDDLDSTGRQKQALMERLRQQLLQLAEQRRATAEPRRDPPSPQPPEQTPHQSDSHAVPTPPDEPGLPGVDPFQTEHGDLAPGQPAESHHGSALDPEHTLAPPPPDHHHAADSGAHRLNKPAEVPGTRINRLALGDSLFASGQSELALQAYKNIETTRLPAADRHWIAYQIANCHRRLGDIPEAERRYRRLAGAVDGGWCAAHARWWLDALATRTALQRDLAAIQGTLKTINEQLEDQISE